MKRILTIGAICFTAVSSFAQLSGSPQMRFIPLLSGFNVVIPTNSTVGLGSTNVLNTTRSGQALYSLTNNNVNGVLNTNGVAPDAFQSLSLVADVDGDIAANAEVMITMGNTNLIPIVTTNSFGQYMVTNWPLAVQQFPNWMNPASTNAYPTFTAAFTNLVTVTLYRTFNIFGTGFGPSIGSAYQVPETTSSFQFSVNGTGVTPVTVFTNLPLSWLQGASRIYATITCATNTAGNGGNALVNQLGIQQPQP